MMNQVVLVGKLLEDISVQETEETKQKHAIMKIRVPRAFKNADGEYGFDDVTIITYNGVAENMAEYCAKGDLIGIKGRIEVTDDKMIVLAERVTFLQSSKTNEKED